MCVTETRRIISENISLLPKILTQRKIEVLYIGLCLVQEEVSEKFFFLEKTRTRRPKLQGKVASFFLHSFISLLPGGGSSLYMFICYQSLNANS